MLARLLLLTVIATAVATVPLAPEVSPLSTSTPFDNSTNSSNVSVTYSHADALIDACAKDFDHDANGVFSREELVDLWKVMQQRALDPYQTSREFYMILQVHPPFLFHPCAHLTALMQGMESVPSEGVRVETDVIELEVYSQNKIRQVCG